MKKHLALLLVSLHLLCAACAEESALPIPFWRYDGVNHWQMDESGAVINLGAHTPGEDWLCTGCGYEILDWGDGAVDVTVYDEYGNIHRYTSFSGEEKTYESVHVYTYNEDGLILKDKEYVNDALYGVTNFAISAEGIPLPVTQTAWNDDGTTAINHFDEHGNCTRATLYDADGALVFETLSEFALNDDGWYYECRTTSRFASGETFFQEINHLGDTLRSLNTYADGTVWSDTTYEYEYRGNIKVWSKQYSFGVLSCEEHYNDEGNLLQEIEYLEDGGKIITQFSEMGDPTTSTVYAADGSVVIISTHEYVYDDEGAQREIHVYTDGVLTESTVFHYDEDMSSTGYHQTVYHADGTCTVTEYDDFFELIMATLYAADGSVISEEAPASASPENPDF